MNTIKEMVAQVLAEAKKKKKGKKDDADKKYEALPSAYGYAEAFDFAPPLGDSNLYKRQGGASFGPMTSAGSAVQDTNLNSLDAEKALRASIRDEIKEQISAGWSAWDVLSEMTRPARQTVSKKSAWSDAAKFFGSDE